LPALGDLVHSLNKELKLGERELLQTVEELDFILNDWL